MNLYIRGRIVYNLKHRHAIHLKLRDTFLEATSLQVSARRER